MANTVVEIRADEFLRRIIAMQRPQLDKPVALGLADTARTAKARAASLIGRRTGLRVATVRSRIFYPFVQVGAYEVVIKSSRRAIRIADFPGVRQVATGVRVNVWGKSQILRGAFVTSRGVYRRRGRARLPIRQLWGPTIAGTFATPEVQSLIATTMKDRLKAALIRRIAAAQRRRV